MNIKTIIKAALFAAIIFLFTRMIAIPIPQLSGAYVNLGDVAIFFAALFLGLPAVLAAAIGSALADITLGSVIYAPATFIIKGLMAFIIVKLPHKKTAMLFAELAMVVLYATYECFIYSPTAAIAGVPLNLVQLGGSFIIAMALLPAFKRFLKK